MTALRRTPVKYYGGFPPSPPPSFLTRGSVVCCPPTLASASAPRRPPDAHLPALRVPFAAGGFGGKWAAGGQAFAAGGFGGAGQTYPSRTHPTHPVLFLSLIAEIKNIYISLQPQL